MRGGREKVREGRERKRGKQRKGMIEGSRTGER